MRLLLPFMFALSACASPMSAPVAAAHTALPRAQESLQLSRFELAEPSPPLPAAACRIGPSELDCETKLLASKLRRQPSSSEPVAEHGVLAITREGGAVLYAQALRTGVSQARLRSSLPVTARR